MGSEMCIRDRPMAYGKTYEETTQDYYTILQKHIQREVERVLDGFGRAA